MNANVIKTTGYLVSSVSVMLLGFVSWKSAQTDPWLAAALFGGMATSVLGMMMRWLSYQIDKE